MQKNATVSKMEMVVSKIEITTNLFRDPTKMIINLLVTCLQLVEISDLFGISEQLKFMHKFFQCRIQQRIGFQSCSPLQYPNRGRNMQHLHQQAAQVILRGISAE